MESKGKQFLWNVVFVLILVAIGFGLYATTKKVDYIWRWERLFQYVINTSSSEIRAPFDGTVTIKDKKITVVSDAGEEKTFKKFDEITVMNGDLVFEGDVIAKVKQIKPGPLLSGLYITLKISVISIFFAIIIGIIAGICRISRNPVLKKLTVTYIELIRGTPLLVQIFIFYFFIGTVLNLDRFTAGVAALSIFAGAYIAEIVRAGIQSIPKGQMEAARSLGMNYYQAMRYIILPQALKRTLPPMAGQFISLIKDSSLVSVISITDLTKAGREVVTSTFSPFEVWFTVALLYLVLTSGLSFIVQLLERRLAESD
ncbi:MAG: polar amino acid transport system permease protein [Deferribacteres bacterium]|jgi:polar amino acid transport system permease protein|nr:amino acid transporter, permease [Deferribacteraceae bacterium]MDK2792777.1 polar amino acid transport system permease protein [Deferribacteres bacterium]